MRLNKYIAENTNLSRRAADAAIQQGRVKVNDQLAGVTTVITDSDVVLIDNKQIANTNEKSVVVLLNKPVGFVCSKDGQGSKTVYDLLPSKFRSLNIAGRLDKDSRGLVVLTNDGNLLYSLTHPSNNKTKIYQVTLDKPLSTPNKSKIERGVALDDGLSRLILKPLDHDGKKWQITMHEGRNRQIRRTFTSLDYKVTNLNRTKIAQYSISNLQNKLFIDFNI